MSGEFWNKDNWRVSPRGNPNIQIAGRPVSVFRRNGGWRWSIGRSAVLGPLYAARSFATAREATANAFEALLVLVDAPPAYDIGDLECVRRLREHFMNPRHWWASASGRPVTEIGGHTVVLTPSDGWWSWVVYAADETTLSDGDIVYETEDAARIEAWKALAALI